MPPDPRRIDTAATSRRLCPRCFESFEAAGAAPASGEALCPACDGRSRARNEAVRAAPAPRRLASELPEVVDASFKDSAAGLVRRLVSDMASWCRGRLWWARLPLWLYFAYVFVRHLSRPGEYRSLFDGINLGIHELGHYLFRPFGEFLTAAGGTITQCLAPVASAVVLLRQRDYFGISVCLMWLATNFWEVAIYAGDARALKLALVAPGVGLMPPGDGAGLHDWNRMLGPLGLLPYDQAISWLFRLAAGGTMLLGLSFGAWLLWRMLLTRTSGPHLQND